MNKNELTILVVWHNENDEKKKACFEENKRTFQEFNPEYNIETVVSPFKNTDETYFFTDLILFQWYVTNKNKVFSERFLLLEWRCWCDVQLKEYFKNVWHSDVVAPSVKYPERDTWSWFGTISQLPSRARLFATGIVPFSGILVSAKAMEDISVEIVKPDYVRLNSELRFATIATMLGYDPIPNPVCSRPMTWKPIVPFDLRYKGLHFPRKKLGTENPLETIEKYLHLDGKLFPKIIHQTWKDEFPREDFQILSETWKNQHPDWVYILWTDEMNRKFIERFFPDFLLQYDSYEHNIQRVDAVRYFILYKVGGLFIDMDFECLKNIEALLSHNQCVFGLEPIEHCTQFDKKMIICNAFMACQPQDDFFLTICNSLSSLSNQNNDFIKNILLTTGPFALTQIYNNYPQKERVRLLPSSIIYPLTIKEARRMRDGDIDEEIQGKINGAHAIHYFSGSWY